MGAARRLIASQTWPGRAMTTMVIMGVTMALVLSETSSNSARAADFTVDSTLDRVDANPGDGRCATAAGACTLRAAVQETNAAAGHDTITLPADVYVLNKEGTDEDAAATGDLDITDDVTITGAGAEMTVIDGAASDRVVHIPWYRYGVVTVELLDLTVRNGFVYEVN